MTSRRLIKAGQTVRIEESRPISKRKRWVVLTDGEQPAAPRERPAAATKDKTP